MLVCSLCCACLFVVVLVAFMVYRVVMPNFPVLSQLNNMFFWLSYYIVGVMLD